MTYTEFEGWVNCWSEDDVPMTFATIEEAEKEIVEHIAEYREGVAEGRFEDAPTLENFRIVEVKPMKKRLIIASQGELDDLIDWMHSHICEDDWPLMTEDAEQWLCTLGPGTHDIPDKHVVPIEYAIEDWLDVLSNYDDSEPFETCVEEVAVE
jgi:hypothetical protein